MNAHDLAIASSTDLAVDRPAPVSRKAPDRDKVKTVLLFRQYGDHAWHSEIRNPDSALCRSLRDLLPPGECVTALELPEPQLPETWLRTVHGEMWCWFHVPRSVPWTSYPVLSDSLYGREIHGCPRKSTKSVFDPSRRNEVAGSISASTASETVTRVVVIRPRTSDPVGDAEWMRLVADSCRSLFVQDIDILEFDGSTIRPFTAPRSTPWGRFLYSYLVNFDAIGRKILHSVMQTLTTEEIALVPDADHYGLFGRPSDEEFRNRIYEGSHSEREAIYDPLFLQLLLAIDQQDRHGGDDPLGDLFLRSMYDDRFVAWIGTGRYPPFVMHYSRRRAITQFAARLGLLDPDARLTRAGKDFVRLIPRSVRDPDILSRWKGKDDETTRVAMDRWIMRSFRTLKKVANTVEKPRERRKTPDFPRTSYVISMDDVTGKVTRTERIVTEFATAEEMMAAGDSKVIRAGTLAPGT